MPHRSVNPFYTEAGYGNTIPFPRRCVVRLLDEAQIHSRLGSDVAEVSVLRTPSKALVIAMPTPNQRELERERTLGELIAAAKQASVDRDEIKRSLETQNRQWDSKLEEILQMVSEQRADHAAMKDDIKKAVNLHDRLLTVEARVSSISADLQSLSSLASVVRTYSLRILFGSLLAVIVGLSAGIAGLGKVIDGIIKWMLG